jgi:hypothetical protein
MAEEGPDTGVQDLRALDRDVARAFASLGEWRGALDADLASRADDAPLDVVRRVAGQSTWVALERIDVSAADRPLRDALGRWVYFLIQARIGCADDVAWARAAAKTAPVDRGEGRSETAWRAAWRGAVAAPSSPAALPWLEAAAELAPALASVATHRASRRMEVAHRLGLAHPAEPLVGVAPSLLHEAATRFLATTDDLWSATFRDVLREGGGLAAVLVAAVGRQAGEGWPARLSAASLRELLRHAFDGPPIEVPALPPARGAASFARGLGALGFAVRSARPSSSVPFALAREPWFVAAHRLSFVVASLAADPLFQGRALGLGSRASSAQARVLARAALFDVRLHAMRLRLGDEAAPAPRDLFDELTARTFGRSMDRRFCGAWPRAREDEPARWLALLETVRFGRSLRDRFDADWFRNPRAWRELRASTLAREPVDEVVVRAGADDLARAFEEALG